ncbi:hypothetical protein M434DRAFT_139909 [Hypoxylon sp. CO27-5]|nr:hypothetical protein M434DRAFT_139909 [Hypoxylon sp. CO27-5]
MSAANPKLHTTEDRRRQRDSRSRPRPQPQPQPQSQSASKSKKRKSTHATAGDDSDADDAKEDGWYAIKDIIDEKLRRGKRYYLVDWEGTDKNGHPHKPSWVGYLLLMCAYDRTTFIRPTHKLS